MSLGDEEEKREIDPGISFPQDNGNDETGAQDSRTVQLMKKLPSMLPVITPELLKEHHIQKQAAHYSFAWRNNDKEEDVGQPVEVSCLRYFCCPCQREPYDDQHAEPAAICGIPYFLFMILAALLAAVTAGAVMAVLFYDPKNGIQPPSLSPSAPPSFLPGTADPQTP